MNIKGVGIGRGVAVGPVIRMAAPLPEPSDAPRAENISAETEIARVEKSLALVNADLNRRAEEAANGDEGAKQAAPILQAIAMFASDPSLAQSIKDLINQGKTAERAVLEGFGAVEDMFRAIGGYQAERAADLHDVGQRVIADLMGAPAPGLPVSETPFVLVAEDLSPADTAALDMSKTLAIVTSQGGPTSHTAILARARGIVAVVSAAEAAELENGTNVIVNAAKGEIVVNPSEDEIAAAEAAKSRAAAAKELRGKPGATKDGHLIPLLANVGKPSDAAKALEYGAEGVGLFRTEFLFIGNSERSELPMNRNSVRNRPTPSAPYSSAFAASDGLPTLASSGIRWPSLVAPGLPRSSLAAAARDLAASAAAISSSLGFTTISPLAALTMTLVPFSSSAASAAETTATMPRARARMAVWEVGPPWEVTMARVLLMSSAAVSAGDRSSATSTNGVSLTGRPGAGAPMRSAITRWPTSCRSAARSAW